MLQLYLPTYILFSGILYSFLHFLASMWQIFHWRWITLFSVSLELLCWWWIPLVCVCLNISLILFFFTLILEGIFFCVNILDCLSFSFSTLKISFLCLLLFIVSIDKSAICLTVALQKIICLPHFPFFLKIFILFLVLAVFLWYSSV